MSELSPDLKQEHLKELSHAWQGRFDAALEALTSRDDVTKEQLFEVLWTDGIMGRLVPDDRGEETAARVALGKSVWPKGKDDPELYWRILYGAEKTKYASANSYSIVAGSYNFMNPAFTGLMQAVYGKRKFYDQFSSHMVNDENSPVSWLLHKIEERSREELRRLNADADRPIIPIGAVGRFHGFHVSVEAYTDSGGLWLKGETSQDHMGIYPWMKYGQGVPPTEVDPEDFHLPETGE